MSFGPALFAEPRTLEERVERLERRLGLLVPENLPKWEPEYTNLTVGNGTVNLWYTELAGLVFFDWEFALGSTSAISGSVTMTPPVKVDAHSAENYRGIAFAKDASTNVRYPLLMRISSSTMVFAAMDPAGTWVDQAPLSSNVPFTWTTNDRLAVQGWCRKLNR